MPNFVFTIKWHKSHVWRGFYGLHENHEIKVRHYKKEGWKLLVDGKQLGGSPHPLGFAILLRIAEEIYVHKQAAGDVLRTAEKEFR